MKLSELIEHLQRLQTEHGDVVFEFDWDIGSAMLDQNDIRLTYDSFSKSYFLSFHPI
jgi:hypothetical protein